MATEHEVRLNYLKNPILEALIDIQVEELDASSLDNLKDAADKLGEGYTSKPITQFFGEFNVIEPEAPSASASKKVVGTMYSALDEKQFFQFRLNGFTFSRLDPYMGWDPFRSEALRGWNMYKSLIGPQRIVQWVVRYINRIVLPNNVELSEYLRTYAEVSEDLPQGLVNYGLHLELAISETKLLIHEQRSMPSNDPAEYVIILDNAIRSIVGFKTSEAEVWEQIEEARNEKNRFFRGSITPLLEGAFLDAGN